MKCPNCSKEMYDSASFCGYCGVRLAPRAQRSTRQLTQGAERQLTQGAERQPIQRSAQQPAPGAAQQPVQAPASASGTPRNLIIIIAVLAILLIAAIVFGVLVYTGTIDLGGGIQSSQRDDDRDRDRDKDDDRDRDRDRDGDDREEEAVHTPVPFDTPTPAGGAAEEWTTPKYLLPNSATAYLTDADLAVLTWEECCLARNEIYARHGRIFATREIRDYFESRSWYNGTINGPDFDANAGAYLNEIERTNISFISQYEQQHWGGSYY